jgi:uncharacterized protein (DUF1684 family)
MKVLRHAPAICLLTLLLPLATTGSAAEGDYVASIEAWRQEFDADLRTGGVLLLIGRFKLEEGSVTLGSDAASTIVLPESAPARLGVLTRAADVFRFEPAPQAAVTVDGKAVSGLTQLATAPGTGRVRAGDITISVRAIGEDFYAFVQDAQNPAAKAFKGNEWFAVDSAYRVRAEFIPYAQPETVPVPMTHMDSKKAFESTGDVTFRMHGRQLRLKCFVDDDKLFVMFQDRTNGRSTYGGGRFLHAPLPQSGATELDFNKAFNPYCSVNTYVACPVPPPQNRLDVAVEAGEKYRVSNE